MRASGCAVTDAGGRIKGVLKKGVPAPSNPEGLKFTVIAKGFLPSDDVMAAAAPAAAAADPKKKK